jgi:hypothetical protein
MGQQVIQMWRQKLFPEADLIVAVATKLATGTFWL